MSPFLSLLMDKVCYLCFNCPSKEKKVADEQTYNRGTKVCNFYDVANTDEQKSNSGSYRSR